MSGELVLTLVQPFLRNADHVNSRLVSKWLYKTGMEDPDRPLPPLGWTVQKSRKKADSVRLAKHATKLGVKQVYTVGELPQIHEALVQNGLYNILGVNVSTDYLQEQSFTCSVQAGFYVPVMYKRQRHPFYSLIFAIKDRTPTEVTAFGQILKDLRINAVFHAGVPDFIYDYAQTLAENHDPEDEHPDYRIVMERAKLPRPFTWHSCTTYRRFMEKNPFHPASEKIFTIG